MKSPILACLFASVATLAVAADCGNCRGDRIVGPGPVRFPCPVCAGSGTVADPLPAVAAAPPAPAKPAAGQPRPAVARVTAARGNVRDAGSGVLVQASGTAAIVLTNWHVVREAREAVAVAWPDGTRTPGRVLAWDAEWDLAAIAVARPGAVPVPIAASAPKIGEPLTIAGYGPHGRYLEQTGPVTMYAGPGRGRPQEWVECRAAARNGDSGGPMFDANGHLAGVLFGSRDGLTVGSCSTRLRAFLATVPGQQGPAIARATADCTDGRCRNAR